jgi:hypothetical protein
VLYPFNSISLLAFPFSPEVRHVVRFPGNGCVQVRRIFSASVWHLYHPLSSPGVATQCNTHSMRFELAFNPPFNFSRLSSPFSPASVASWARLLEGGYCHAPCARHDISAPIDLIPTCPFICHYHDVSSYPCDSPYDPKPPDIIPVGPESDWIFETRPAAALRYICSQRLGFDFGIMFHTSYLWYLILESWLHVSFCFHFTI